MCFSDATGEDGVRGKGSHSWDNKILGHCILWCTSGALGHTVAGGRGAVENIEDVT